MKLYKNLRTGITKSNIQNYEFCFFSLSKTLQVKFFT